jgi:hypothetical protein
VKCQANISLDVFGLLIPLLAATTGTFSSTFYVNEPKTLYSETVDGTSLF